jgi:hypothetical protein
MKPANCDIRHDEANRRFVTTVDGHEGRVEYVLDDGTMRIWSTQVPDPISNRGIAAALTEAALQFAETHALGVDPVCPYTAAYLRRRSRR